MTKLYLKWYRFEKKLTVSWSIGSVEIFTKSTCEKIREKKQGGNECKHRTAHYLSQNLLLKKTTNGSGQRMAQQCKVCSHSSARIFYYFTLFYIRHFTSGKFQKTPNFEMKRPSAFLLGLLRQSTNGAVIALVVCFFVEFFRKFQKTPNFVISQPSAFIWKQL